jgi:hydroxyacylglutathione hydrolase
MSSQQEDMPADRVHHLSAGELDRLRSDGVVVIDTRDRYEFAAGHAPGSVNIELADDLGFYMSRLWTSGTSFALVMGPDQEWGEVYGQCAGIPIEGVLSGGVRAWADTGRDLATSRVTDVEGMAAALRTDGAHTLDVRRPDEWRDGRVPGAIHVPIADLPGRESELGGDRPVYVYCRSGHRASIGASLLERAGVPAILVDGGFPDWRKRGLPVEED